MPRHQGAAAHCGRDVHVSLCRGWPSFLVHLSCHLRCAARNDIFPLVPRWGSLAGSSTDLCLSVDEVVLESELSYLL